VYLARGETELALSELEEAEELDDEIPILPMLWANYYMTTHDVERAAAYALEAIERKPHDWQTRLSAAQVLRAASRYEEMRVQARAILEMVPSAQVAQVTELITQVLGPTALEAPLEDEAWDDDEDWDLPDSEFQLGGGSSLLGDGELDLGGGPSLGGDLMEGQEGSLLNSGETSTLRLGGGEDLSLDLSE
jgi:tetratricopeptide (TPR) repeat protein